MSLAPLLEMPVVLILHVLAALVALILGPVALYRPRRDRVHKRIGYAWVTAMATVAVSSFWLDAQILPLVAGFGPIHVLSVVTLVSLGWALRAIRRRHVQVHQQIMRQLYWWAIGVTGLLTLLPGRDLNRMLFADRQQAALIFMAIGFLFIVGITIRDARRTRHRNRLA